MKRADGCVGGDAVWVYARDTGVRMFDIYTVRDGRSERVTSDEKSMQPSISPDGKRIAFTKVTGQDWECCGPEFTQVYVMDVDGGNARPLTDGKNDTQPVFSPDGESVAFLRDSGGWESDLEPDLVVTSASGRREPKVIAENVDDTFPPAWSPDGRELALAVPKQHAIDVFDLDSGERRRVVVDGPRFDGLTWTPEGDGFFVDFDPTPGDAQARRGLHRVGRDGSPTASLDAGPNKYALLPDGRLGILLITGTRAKPDASLEALDTDGKRYRKVADVKVHFPYNAITIGAGACADR